MKNYKGEIARLQEQAHARAAAYVEPCTCIARHIEVFGYVEFLDGVAHEQLELTPEQQAIIDSQKACRRDHSGVQVTIVPPLSESMKLKLGLQVFPVNE
jgi:hypothetical protein